MPIERRNEQRAGLVAPARLIQVGAGRDERLGRVDVALSRGEQQRRQSALCRDELVQLILTIDSRPALAAAAGDVASGLRIRLAAAEAGGGLRGRLARRRRSP